MTAAPLVLAFWLNLSRVGDLGEGAVSPEEGAVLQAVYHLLGDKGAVVTRGRVVGKGEVLWGRDETEFLAVCQP